MNIWNSILDTISSQTIIMKIKQKIFIRYIRLYVLLYIKGKYSSLISCLLNFGGLFMFC